MRGKGVSYDAGFINAGAISHASFIADVVRRELRIIRDDLHCNAVRIIGGDAERLEALQNCAKHAPDSKVMLELAADDSWLTFTVVDGGPGFVETQTHAGTGLRGMADRLAALGGSFEVQSAPGNGTRVRGRLPVQRPIPVVQDKRPPAVAFAQAVRNAAGPN